MWNPSKAPHITDCLMALPIAVILIFIRAVFERIMMRPLANALGLVDRRFVSFPSNPILEAAYKKWKRKVPSTELEKLTGPANMTVREIDRWLHFRRKMEIPSVVYKFSECGWHCLFYSCSFLGALYVLWDKPWLWDTSLYFKGYPNQTVSESVFWVYQIQIGFYLSLIFSMAVHFDSKKKDRLEMFIHHMVTLSLILASWSVNFVRIGSVVVLIHDIADPFLMLSKLLWYAKKRQIAEAIFVCTIIIWTISRLMIYPWRILWSVVTEGYTYIPKDQYSIQSVFYTYWVCAVLLGILQVLHFFWTMAIVRVVLQKWKGKLEKDVRSETESSDGSVAEDSPDEQKGEKNGKLKSN